MFQVVRGLSIIVHKEAVIRAKLISSLFRTLVKPLLRSEK